MNRAELERALGELHAESWGWALACCGRDHHLAEEALQTAYLRMLSGAATFDGRSSVKTWVFGVVRLTALGERRRHFLWSARAADVEAAAELPDPATAADVGAESGEQRAALIAALKLLSARQREVLELVFYHSMTIEEAARVMKVSLGSARTHYDRGKKGLAATLTRAGVR